MQRFHKNIHQKCTSAEETRIGGRELIKGKYASIKIGEIKKAEESGRPTFLVLPWQHTIIYHKTLFHKRCEYIGAVVALLLFKHAISMLNELLFAASALAHVSGPHWLRRRAACEMRKRAKELWETEMRHLANTPHVNNSSFSALKPLSLQKTVRNVLNKNHISWDTMCSRLMVWEWTLSSWSNSRLFISTLQYGGSPLNFFPYSTPLRADPLYQRHHHSFLHPSVPSLCFACCDQAAKGPTLTALLGPASGWEGNKMSSLSAAWGGGGSQNNFGVEVTVSLLLGFNALFLSQTSMKLAKESWLWGRRRGHSPCQRRQPWNPLGQGFAARFSARSETQEWVPCSPTALWLLSR